MKCHGPEKQKGKVTLHNVDSGLAAGKSLERWELILEVLSGECRPRRANGRTRRVGAVTKWIETGLRAVAQGGETSVAAGTAVDRFEYENTIRDLIGSG